MGILTTPLRERKATLSSGKPRCRWDIAKAKGYANSYQCHNASKPGFLFCGTHLRINRSLPTRYQEEMVDK